MTAILVICPSRQRPDNITALLECWQSGADLVVCVDDDDPTIDEYRRQPVDLLEGPPQRLGPWLNQVALENCDRYDILALFGDDVRPRTPNWDRHIADAMTPMGVVYGNDLLHGEANPSVAFMDAEIVRRLGYMAPPEQVHLYFDNFWKALGERLGTLTYLPDVVLEHMHPHAGKAEWDDSYRRSNSRDMYRHDSAAFERYMTQRLEYDLEKLR